MIFNYKELYKPGSEICKRLRHAVEDDPSKRVMMSSWESFCFPEENLQVFGDPDWQDKKHTLELTGKQINTIVGMTIDSTVRLSGDLENEAYVWELYELRKALDQVDTNAPSQLMTPQATAKLQTLVDGFTSQNMTVAEWEDLKGDLIGRPN